jgi:protein-L-isoaspartate(D-aspartate) O-methyltransferase
MTEVPGAGTLEGGEEVGVRVRSTGLLITALVWGIAGCGPGRSADAPRTSEPAPTATVATEPAAFQEKVEARLHLVSTHLETPSLGAPPIQDPRVLKAMRRVPRHAFVPFATRLLAYRDTPLPIGHGQTISQPYVVAYMTQLLELEPGDRVLEIGTGSAYQAAVLAEITDEVYTIEIVEPLAEQAARRLQDLGYTRVRTRKGDGYHGWPEAAPFDAVIVTAAAGHVPPPLWEQLAPGGRMVIPVGGTYEVQQLLLLTKQPDGSRVSRALMPVRFVPFTRAE